jgi:hypothetical protein
MSPHGSAAGQHAGLSETISSDNTIPAVMVGVASSVIMCAVFLYLSDVRDRWRHQRMLEDRRERRREIESNKHMETIDSSGYWVSSSEYHPNNHRCPPFPMLMPPIMDENNDQPEFVEDISISPVSTMTASLAPLDLESTATNSCLHLADSDDDDLDASLKNNITELSDAHRVSQDMDLASLVDLSRIQTTRMTSTTNPSHHQSIMTFEEMNDEDAYNKSMMIAKDVDYMSNDEDESGWTSSRSDSSSEMSIATYLKSVHSSKSRGSSSSVGSNGTSSSSTDSQELLGERCLEDTSTPQKSEGIDDTSLERSPDTPYEDEYEIPALKKDLAQKLEQLSNTSLDESSPDVPRVEEGVTRNELAQLEQLYGTALGSSPDKSRVQEDTRNELEQMKQLYDISLDSSLDTTGVEESTRNELAQLEQLYNKMDLPFQEYTCKTQDETSDEESAQDYVRNIYFVPVAATRVDLGIKLEDASCPLSYPSVKVVRDESPLGDRIFVGDLILAVNNEEAVGLGALDVANKFLREQEDDGPEPAEVVKLTVMSAQSDGSDSDSAISQASVDTGRAETAVEV